MLHSASASVERRYQKKFDIKGSKNGKVDRLAAKIESENSYFLMLLLWNSQMHYLVYQDSKKP